MAIDALIAWNAPSHFYVEKRSDWYWSVGIITLALAGVCIIFGQIITGIFVLAAAAALVLHASQPPKTVHFEINDRGIIADNTLYPFVTLESFWVPHDEFPPKLLVKSRKTFMPLIIFMIDEVDLDDVREVMLKYIAERELREPFLKHLLTQLGF